MSTSLSCINIVMSAEKRQYVAHVPFPEAETDHLISAGGKIHQKMCKVTGFQKNFLEEARTEIEAAKIATTVMQP